MNDFIETKWIIDINYKKNIILFCNKNNLKINVNNMSLDSISVTCRARQYNRIFNIILTKSIIDNVTYYISNQEPRLLRGMICIYGFNTPIVSSYYHKIHQNNITSLDVTYYTPTMLAKIYKFSSNLTGSGQLIGIIELGGGFKMSDITSYLKYLGINTIPKINSVSVDGAINNIADVNSSVEVTLVIEIIAAIVPSATINVYFAQNTDASFYNAISKAINDNCNVISISWGAPEIYFTNASKTSYNLLFKQAALKKITILAAAGDNGNTDGVSGLNIDFPSSSPYVLACGGTSLSSKNNTIISEIVWNNNNGHATGGGISNFFSKPSYQSNIPYNMRCTPDISADADPNTGYLIYMNDTYMVVGGTSAVAPLISGLIGRVNMSVGNIGFIHNILYSNINVCRDIISGNNNTTGIIYPNYNATKGWDLCSGNGVINGMLFSNLFKYTSLQSKFTSTTIIGNKILTVYFTDSSTGNPNKWYWDFGDNTNSILQNPTHIYYNTG